MKKHAFLKCLVAILLLTSMLLTMFLGVTKSEYFKSFSKELDIEAKPDLMLEYYLYDGSSTGGKGFKETQGVYKNAESFSQKVIVGRNNAYDEGIYSNAEWNNGTTLPFYGDGYPDNEAGNLVSQGNEKVNIKYNGEGIIYQIKLPVDEAGYYVLNFQVDFLLATIDGGWADQKSDFFVQTYDRAIGCEILNYNDGFTFKDNTKRLDLYSRSGNDSVHGRSKKSDAKSTEQKSYINKKYFEADSLYQWKTLSPSRAENVSLAFKVEPEDVDNGYVLWMWDFAGLFGARTWKLEFTDISVEKTMELDGSTDSRDGSSDPYFMFPQASFMNSQILLSLDNINKLDDYDYPLENLQTGQLNYNVRSVQHRGKTSYSKGRGTFATSATANSLTFQAESLFFGYGNEDFADYQYLDEQDKAHAGNGHSNPVAVYIPLKNIQYNTDYKVTFDISFARQGKYNLDKNGNPAAIQRDRFYGYNYNANMFGSYLADYVDPSKYTAATSSASATNELFRKGEHLFSSYLLSNKATNVNRIEDAHVADMGLITYADKHYQGAPLTKYDEITSLTNLNNTTVESVNNTYSNDIYSSNTSKSRNWFNAVQHTEYNGQNEIHWLTFYNSTFSFNIPEAENGSIDLNDLYWVWAMDSLISGCYYRIKLENVRIEKVVKYTSSLNVNGVEIAGTQIDLEKHSVNDPKDDSKGFVVADDTDESTGKLNFFRSFRGINGTGQNYQARGFVLDENTAVADKIFTSEGNIYAPIIDATKFKVSDGSEAYQIALDGFTVCQGGVAKYVFSVDGGRTWEDMTFTGGKAVSPNQLTAAEKGVNQHTSGQTRYDETKFSTIGLNISDYTFVEFTDADRANANFSEFKLVADLSKYKNQANLDVIIAAVPEKDTDCKCEILRVINFNQIRNYMAFPFDFVSDIKVNGSNASLSPLNVNRLDETNSTSPGHYHNGLVDPEATGFTQAKTWMIDTDPTNGRQGPSSTTGYARMVSNSYAYEDIRALYSDFPVKTTLGITGWAIVEGGVEDYYWSADEGKTWVLCTSKNSETGEGTDEAAPHTRDLVSAQYKRYYYDGVAVNYSNEEDASLRNNHCFRDSIDGQFSGGKDNPVPSDTKGSGSMLTANLSKYKGEVVDVIFAAKPNGSDVYVPVGRIDNVAVYGATGTFYTHINSVRLGGTLDYSEEPSYGKAVGGTLIEPDYFDVEGKPLNHVTSGGAAAPQWDLGYLAIDGKEFSYTIFEPNNVNVFNSRLYNNELNEIPSGGQVSIDGYTINLGGSLTTSSYKYTLDGGETWSTVPKQAAGKPFGDSEKTYAQKSDASLNQAGTSNNYQTKDAYDRCLVFNIPALPDGAIRDLLVVAEDKDGDVMPVLHIKLKIKGNNVGLFTYDGLHSYRSNFECFDSTSSISVPFKREDFKDTMRFTFPVEREGVHTLTFNAQVTTDSVTTNNDKYVKGGDRAIVYGWDRTTNNGDGYFPGYRLGRGTTSMTVPKTNYITGETLKVSYNWDVVNEHTAGDTRGAIDLAWIGIVNADTLAHVNPDNLEINQNGKDVPYVYPPYVVPLSIDSNDSAKYSGTVEIPNLPAGKYKVIFANHWHVSRWVSSLASAPGNGANAEFHYLGEPIDIVVQDEFETTAKIFHDDVEKGGELYYAKQGLYSSNDSRFDKAAQWSTQNVYASNDVELYFNATKEDVKRGYIILDWDLTKLAEDKEYVLNIKNLMYSYGVRSTKHLTTYEDGNATYKIRVPALEAGTHKFAFSSYTTVYSPIVHKGLNQTVTYGNTNRGNGGNYLAEGAYMSVAKTVYTVGEPIHVSYNTAGAGTGSNPNPLNSPWIGITKANDEGRDVVIGRVFLEKNAVGSVAFNSGMNGCVEVIDELAHLPAGDYKLYFRDNSANIYGDKVRGDNIADNLAEYWPQMNITDPIAITIIDPNKSNEKPYKQTYYFDEVRYGWTEHEDDYYNGVSGWISLDKTVFRVGEDITFDYNKSEAFGNAVDNRHLYLGFAPPNFTGDTFITPEDDNICFGNFADKVIDIPDNIAPGRYQLYCCDYEFAQARQNGSVIAVIDIVILPEDGEEPPVMDLTHIHGDESVAYGTSVPAYEYSRNPISINITDADVTRGFVEFEYKLKNLVENADIVYSTEMFYDRQPEEEPYLMNGDYITFGEYPQSLKSPTVTILTDVVPDSRGYYMGDDGNYYAKVVSTPYGENYTFADGNTPVVNGEVYYFKVEPIKWRILYQDTEYLDVLCESIIVNRPYDGDSNKYAHSDVREWLNDEFYKTAFTEIQKQYIIKKEVDNSLASTGYAANSYVSDNTNDKIYLPSYATVTNTEYGFMNANNVVDTNRAKAVTDYARAKGAWTNMSEVDGNIGNGIWMLRSPADSASNFIREGYFNGEITDGGISINVNAHGVAPMLRLSIVDESSRITTKYIFKDVGNTTIYRANYSALLNNVEQNPAVNYKYKGPYAGSFMSVPKTYFEVGEKIPVKYAYKTTYDKNAWIGIATTGLDDGSEKDSYIRWFSVTKGASGEFDDIRTAPGAPQAGHAKEEFEGVLDLPAGEYKIWFMYDNEWWDYDGSGNYNNPYMTGNAITDPICIKIVDKDNPDYSLNYQAWMGEDKNEGLQPMYAYLSLEKNVINEGDTINFKVSGRTLYMCALLADSNNVLIDSEEQRLYIQDLFEDTDERPNSIGYWKSVSMKTDGLAPGKYKFYYTVEANYDKIYTECGAIVAIIDITILPTTEEAPTAKLDVVYTNTDGIIVKKTINDSVMLNGLLNSHTGNYNLTDDDNKVEGIIELTDVQPNSTVQFIFSYDRYEIESDDIECKVDDVPWDTYDVEYSNVTNFQISKPAFTYVPVYGQNAVTNYSGATMSLPGTYFVKGTPIKLTYDYSSCSNIDSVGDDKTNICVIVTADTLVEDVYYDSNGDGKVDSTTGDKRGNLYMTGAVKYRTLQANADMDFQRSGTIDLSNDLYSLSADLMSYVGGASNYIGKPLPTGTYKVWLFHNVGNIMDNYDFGVNPFKKIAPYLLTEPITFKIIDENNPDFTVKSELYSPYQGKEVYGHDNSNTRLTLEKTIFTQGEKIYYTIGMDYCARQILLTGGHNSNLETTSVYDNTTKGKTWQYAEHGVTTKVTGVGNYLDTTGLSPGQYKLYYFMGENVQKAYRGADFSLGGNHSTYCKLYTIIDIIILPDWTHQNITVNYTKYDGTSASVSSGDLSMGGKILSTSTTNGKVINKFHMGIYFNETITDIKPGTDITITATTNIHTSQAWGPLEATPIVLKNDSIIKNSYYQDLVTP